MTSFDLQQFGLTLLNAGRAINERIDQDFDILDFTQIHEMSNKAQELLLKSKALFARAVIELGEEAKADLEALQQANVEIAEAIRKINNIQKVINITAKLITVAGNVIAGNLTGIARSAQDVLKELRS